MEQSSPHSTIVTEGTRAPGLNEDESKKAAEIIQRTYRGHRARRELNGYGLTASTRWYEAVKDARYRQIITPTAPQQQDGDGSGAIEHVGNEARQNSSAMQNWSRVTQIAKHAGADDSSDNSQLSGISEDSSEDDLATSGLSQAEQAQHEQRRKEATARRKKQARMMDLSYFLEMVDLKHRYGSNLRKYHAHWKTQDTNQNFFYWLDQGDGKDTSLPECSRARLDKMQVRYLSREERQNYLVQVDQQGLLRWAKNGELVWTKDELYRDSIKGIVPTTDSTPMFKHNITPDNSSSDELSRDDLKEDNTIGDEGEGYVNEDFHRARGPAKIKYVSAAALFNHMVRTSLKKGHKWIFVADTSFRMYIGYKQSGAFQHSSFLNGARITAAGLIKVKKGQLRSLSPLSGHYRPPTANFRLFVQSLKQEGVDMSRVSISKSYAVLVGMESWTKTTKKAKSVEENVVHEGNKLLHPEKVMEEEEAKRDKSKSAERERLYLEQQRLQQKQNTRLDGRLGASFDRLLDRLPGISHRPKGNQLTGSTMNTPGTGSEEKNVPASASHR